MKPLETRHTCRMTPKPSNAGHILALFLLAMLAHAASGIATKIDAFYVF